MVGPLLRLFLLSVTLVMPGGLFLALAVWLIRQERSQLDFADGLRRVPVTRRPPPSARAFRALRRDARRRDRLDLAF